MLNSRFAEVEQSGEIDKEENTTKVCSSKIKVKAELKLADMINLGVEWIKEVTSPAKVKKDDKLNDNGGDSAQIGSSGDYAKSLMYKIFGGNTWHSNPWVGVCSFELVD